VPKEWASLGRSGGNITGVTSLSSVLIAKRLQLLKEMLPKVSRVAVLSDDTPNSRMSVRDAEAGARALNIAMFSVAGRDTAQLERAVGRARHEQAGALVVIGSPLMFIERVRIADLALKHRLPTAVGGRDYAEAGGLFSHAVNYPGLFHRAASYVDKILKGAKPADLPVEQPTKLDLVINLKTAKALGTPSHRRHGATSRNVTQGRDSLAP
jgi:ABC-type uncharacterized transport system substrate-binding protein